VNTAEVEGVFGFFIDPILDDTDDDGLSDLIEIAYYINFRDERDLARLTGNNISLIESLRSDYAYELDPLDNDTDNDGLEDGAEVVAGTSLYGLIQIPMV